MKARLVPCLDYDDTVLATVISEDEKGVDRIQERDVMRAIDAGTCPR